MDIVPDTSVVIDGRVSERIEADADPDAETAGDNGRGGNGRHEATSDDRTAEEFAAVAALLEHKGLLDAERTEKSARRGDELPSWKKR